MPQFSAVKTEHGNDWVLDHGRKIALLSAAKIGLFRQFPGEAVDEQRLIADEGLNEWFMIPGLRLWTQVMLGKYKAYWLNPAETARCWPRPRPYP